MQQTLTTITDLDGQFARFALDEYQDTSRERIVVYPESGGEYLVSRELFIQDRDLFMLKAHLNEIVQVGVGVDEQTVIPVVQEEAHISRRTVEAGSVRVRKVVHTERVTIDEPAYVDRVEVRRVTVNTVVDGDAPQPRTEGDTLIIPVVKEMIVIEKRLVVTEEVYVTRQRVEVHLPQEVELRREEIIVERRDADGKRTDEA